MRLEDVLQTAPTLQNQSLNAYQKQQEQESSFPASWGPDTVSISDRARSASATASVNTAVPDEPQEEDGTTEAFAEYMDKARGATSDSGSPEEQLEALRKKLKELEDQLSQVATSTSMPEETKNSRMQSLNAQISQVSAQTAELTSGLKNGSK